MSFPKKEHAVQDIEKEQAIKISNKMLQDSKCGKNSFLKKHNMMVHSCRLFTSHRSIFLFASLLQKSLPSFPYSIHSQFKKSFQMRKRLNTLKNILTSTNLLKQFKLQNYVWIYFINYNLQMLVSWCLKLRASNHERGSPALCRIIEVQSINFKRTLLSFFIEKILNHTLKNKNLKK